MGRRERRGGKQRGRAKGRNRCANLVSPTTSWTPATAAAYTATVPFGALTKRKSAPTVTKWGTLVTCARRKHHSQRHASAAGEKATQRMFVHIEAFFALCAKNKDTSKPFVDTRTFSPQRKKQWRTSSLPLCTTEEACRGHAASASRKDR